MTVSGDPQLHALRAETQRMADCLATADLTAPVPACPTWSVEDLGEHLGRVHRWAAAAVTTGADPGRYPPAERDGLALATWYAGCADELLRVLEATDAEKPAWAFPPADQTAGFWRRRQLHETTVHRVDAEQAAGRPAALPAALPAAQPAAQPAADPASPMPTPDMPSDAGVDAPGLVAAHGIPADRACDGVDEVLRLFLPRMLVRRGEPASQVFGLDRPVAFVCPDVDRAWTLAVDGERLEVADGVRDAAAVVTGPAVLTYLAIWGRAPRTALSLEGDTALARDLLSRVLTP